MYSWMVLEFKHFVSYISRTSSTYLVWKIMLLVSIVEIFLQHIENTHLKQLLDTKSIIFYTWYVDDILLIYDTKCINSNAIHEYINQIHPNLQLTPIHENNNCINFLDLLIMWNPPTRKSIYTRNPQPLTQLSTTYPIIPLNTKSQLTDTISPERNHYH